MLLFSQSSLIFAEPLTPESQSQTEQIATHPVKAALMLAVGNCRRMIRTESHTPPTDPEKRQDQLINDPLHLGIICNKVPILFVELASDKCVLMEVQRLQVR